MRDPLKFDDDDFRQLIDQFLIQEDEEFFGDDFFDNYLVQKILDAKYDNKTDINDAIAEQKHLNDLQKDTLKQVLDKYKNYVMES